LGRVFNFRSGCMHTMHLLPGIAIQPNLELKTWPKQLLGSLPLVIALPALAYFTTPLVTTKKRFITLSPGHHRLHRRRRDRQNRLRRLHDPGKRHRRKRHLQFPSVRYPPRFRRGPLQGPGHRKLQLASGSRRRRQFPFRKSTRCQYHKTLLTSSLMLRPE